MDTQKLQALISGALDSLYDLKSELDRVTSEENLTDYLKSRFRNGKSIRQVANEIGWNFNTLRRFCDRMNIPRPNRKFLTAEISPQPKESHPSQNLADRP